MDKLFWTRWQWAKWEIHHPVAIVINLVVVIAVAALIAKRGVR